MLLQVHDELLFEVPKGEIEETAELVRRVMEWRRFRRSDFGAAGRRGRLGDKLGRGALKRTRTNVDKKGWTPDCRMLSAMQSDHSVFIRAHSCSSSSTLRSGGTKDFAGFDIPG